MPEKAEPVRVTGYRCQRTLAANVKVEGVGFVTGARVRVRLRPAPPDSGVMFRRTDRPNSPAVPAHAAFVTDTRRRTTLGPDTHGVTLVEHLLATLAGLRIDNCEIDIDGPEPPGLDGSAAGYVKAIAECGAVEQPATRAIWTVKTPVVISMAGATIGLHPSTEPGLRVSYLLDYGVFGPIHRQTFTLDVRPDEFVREVASCRTFVTEAEVQGLHSQGIGRHLTSADLLVFGPDGPINNTLRFGDEPARHKVLDILGDLALCGFDLSGHVVAYRSGHALNVQLALRLATLADSCRKSKSRKVSTSLNQAA
ncbi:MAG: UDP-3-O-[3-hydroxymyristoyl] N-acetylglucosamine deacetylase [Planctomycetaceae bacterium]|nr:UDP-3-O-[3-hydroxymyristoyl] N-acetylglucosamine deacetylase [Planctomycetaceae bacterium]